jgi:hypothetical protein
MDIIYLIDCFTPVFVSEAPRRPSLIRYADEDMASPSCCDWIIPGTLNLYS